MRHEKDVFIGEGKNPKQREKEIFTTEEREKNTKDFRFWRWAMITFSFLIVLGLCFAVFFVFKKLIFDVDQLKNLGYSVFFLITPLLASITLIILFVINNLFKNSSSKNEEISTENEENLREVIKLLINKVLP
ncbi:MAG: hypothetical protein OXC61_10640 [Flavobacteriaceae bacterium]|nr:hypothetical protein [Flavobacteriaceae bacterium]